MESKASARGTSVHPTAVVAPGARLASGVRIGPYAVVGEDVDIGEGAVIHSHAVVDGHTTLGPGVEIYPHAAVGLRPQDRKYDGSPTGLLIGARTIVRECATLQPGSVGPECGITSVGEGCLIMAYCHIAHDCRLGNGIVMANGTQLAGHSIIEDFATLGGMTTVHQFVRIGRHAFTGAATRVQCDVPPFVLADGHPARLIGINAIGLERGGFSREAIATIRRAYRAIFRSPNFADGLAHVEATLARESSEVAELCRFVRASSRGVTRARTRRAHSKA